MRPALALVVLPALVALAGAPAASAPSGDGLQRLRPALETPANFDDEAGGDADADDPAIWVHPGDPLQSVVLGTLKNGGLDAYDLEGRLLDHVDTVPSPAPDTEAGRFNNVDILPSSPWGAVAVVTDRGRDRLRVFRLDSRGAAAGSELLTEITVADPPRVFSATEEAVEEQNTAYGLAVRQTAGASYAVVSQRNRTALRLVRLTGTDSVSYTRVDTLKLPARFALADGTSWRPCGEPGEKPQVEGMVVDQSRDVLYAAQEDVGVWRIPLQGGEFGQPELIERVREFGRAATYHPATEECEVSDTPSPDSGQYLSADAEGLTFVTENDRPVRLVVSSQGDDTFAEFSLAGDYVDGFRVSASSAGVDSVQESDGSALVLTPLGPRFPGGLLVVHDGQNTPAVGDRPNSNFKFVPWVS